MKLVIQTQFKENYGAHSWDGTGVLALSTGSSKVVARLLYPMCL